MSKYTTEVRYICETASGLSESVGCDSVDTIIVSALPKVFNFSFPIFDENYRNNLERKILKHYYTREIGAETVGLWKLWLNTRLNEVMPYYNQLYKSELLTFNPLYDTDIKRTHTLTGNNNRNDNENNNSNNTQTSNTHSITGETTNTSDSVVSEKDYTTDSTVNTNSTNETITDMGSSETTNQTAHGKTSETGTMNNAGEKLDAFSDTPQGSLSNVEGLNYLTNARQLTDKVDRTTENENITDTTNTGNIVGTTEGSVNVNGESTTTNSVKDIGTLTNTGSGTTTNSGSASVDKTDTYTGGNTKVLNSSINTLEEYTESVVGKQSGKDYSEMLLKFRQTFINIDMMVIDELKDLFLNLW